MEVAKFALTPILVLIPPESSIECHRSSQGIPTSSRGLTLSFHPDTKLSVEPVEIQMRLGSRHRWARLCSLCRCPVLCRTPAVCLSMAMDQALLRDSSTKLLPAAPELIGHNSNSSSNNRALVLRLPTAQVARLSSRILRLSRATKRRSLPKLMLESSK